MISPGHVLLTGASAGIGEALGKKIIDYRTTVAPFQSIEEIERVSGIGPATFADIPEQAAHDKHCQSLQGLRNR